MSPVLWVAEGLLLTSAIGAAVNLVTYVATAKFWLSSAGWHLAVSLTAVLLSLAGVALIVPDIRDNNIGVYAFVLCIAPLPITQWWRVATMIYVRREASLLDGEPR